MQITGISNTPYIFGKMPAYVPFEGKKKVKKQADTFEKQKEPYSVDNSIEDFAQKLSVLIQNGNFDKNDIKQLIREYVPRTNVEDNAELLKSDGASAQFRLNTSISKSSNKIHFADRKIVICMDKKDQNPNIFFKNLVHEMIHNLQTNKEKEVNDKIYKDFFSDSLSIHNRYRILFNIGFFHASNMIKDNFHNKFGVFKSIESKKYRKFRDKYVYSFDHNPFNITEKMQAYDLAVLTLLSMEEEAYTKSDNLTLKYYNTPNKKAKKIEKLFKSLKEIVVDDLKKTGMSEEKMAEYKKLIGW